MRNQSLERLAVATRCSLRRMNDCLTIIRDGKIRMKETSRGCRTLLGAMCEFVSGYERRPPRMTQTSSSEQRSFLFAMIEGHHTRNEF
jgi:hypothetical protein